MHDHICEHTMYVQIRTSVREREQWNLFVRTFDRAALISGAGRTEPLPNRDPDNNGPNTEHVEALIAFIAEKNLVVFLTGAALFTYQVFVFLPSAAAYLGALVVLLLLLFLLLQLNVLGYGHDLLHRP